MTYVPKLFCICGGELKPQKVGCIVEVFVHSSKQEPRPYYKISADILKCVACDTRVFINAPEPMAMTHQESYPNFIPTHSAWLR